jgi:transposase
VADDPPRPDEPRSADQAARLVGFSGNWARALVRRYNAQGADGLADRRATAGRKPKPSADRRAELVAALQPPPDGGLGSGPKLRRYVGDRYGVALGHTAAWNYLKAPGFRLKVPRPRHPEAATAEGQAGWKTRPGEARCRAAPAAPREGRRGPGRG